MHHLARSNTPGCDFAHDTLHILYLPDLFPQQVAFVRVAEKILHHRLAVAYRAHILERECQPAVQQTPAHRRNGMVEDIVERLALCRLPAEEFEVMNGKAVEPYVFVFLNTAQVLYMTRLQVLRHI